MNNDSLKIIIAQAISNITSRTKNEYASLSEIYDEVSNLRKEKTNKAIEAQIRAMLQENCSQYSSYRDKNNYFQTKGKSSGLWKNKITGENELTPYINNIIKLYPGIDITMLKNKLYQIIDLAPGDRAISLTRSGEMKIDQIMRNFVSHKDNHKDIKFENGTGIYKMYYVGDEENIPEIDLYKNISEKDTVYDIISEEDEKPENNYDVKLNFVNNDLIPKKISSNKSRVFIRKNDINTWIKREERKIKNGNLAECLVFVAEKLRLQDLDRIDLADKVKWISRDSGDGYGYDILSYDLKDNGQEYEIQIEVKNTPNLSDDFVMSSNELNYAREHKDTYRLYRVAKVKTKTPVCKVISVDLNEVFNFEANDYKVSIK